MRNRFVYPIQRALGSIVLLALISTKLFAQQGFFDFTPPPGTPHVIAVGGACTASVSQGVMPTVASTVGATITQSYFDSLAAGYSYYDAWPVGSVVVVEWHVEDNMGHVANFQYSVTFRDLSGPVFDVSGAISPLLVGSIAQVPPQAPLPVTDNCSPVDSILQTYSQTMPPPLCEGGTFTRTWTATDTSGNSSVYTQIIQVFRDSLLPVVTVSPSNGSAPCSTLPTSYTNWLAAQMAAFTAIDHSGIAAYTNNAPPALAACPQPVTVTFRATDHCTLYTTRTATFSSTDTQPPSVITPPADTVAYCTTQQNYQQALGEFISTHAYAVVSDACSPQLTWTMVVNGQQRDSLGVVNELLTSFSNPCGFQLVGGQTYPKVRGYVRIDFFAEDQCENEVFVGQGVFGVIDTTPPAIAGQAITWEECGGGNDQAQLNAWINAYANATLTDACSTPVFTSFSYTTSDGQTGSGAFGAGPYPVVPAGRCQWHSDVRFQFADDCGNTSADTFRFAIRDLTPPQIGGFSDTTIIFCPNTLPNTLTAQVFDNCAPALTPTYSLLYGDTVCVGNYTIRALWSVTDSCGNTANRTQYFLIRDTLGPVFSVVPDTLVWSCDDLANLPASVSGVDVQAADQCGLLNAITYTDTNNQNPDPNVCGHYQYEITRRFVASDVCGNTTTATQLIQIRDLTPPGPATPLLDTFIACQNLPISPQTPAASDNCGPVLAPVTLNNQSIVAGSCPDSYTIVVTWQTADVCGNVGAFSRNYVVIDTLKPVISNIPANITVDCDEIPAPPELLTLIASDNCDLAPSIQFAETEIRDPDLSHCAHWSNYQINRTWTVTDACGNARAYTQSIMVMDDTGPELALADTISMPNAAGQCGAYIVPPTPYSIFDICSSLPETVILRDTTPVTGPPSSMAPCDTLTLVFSSSHIPPNQPVAGDATLIIYLDIVDGSEPEEYFKIFGENGYQIGITSPTSPLCGSGSTSFTIESNLLNEWLTDGQLVLTLAPNGTGEAAINPICPGRRVRGEISYSFLQPQTAVTVQYQIDGGSLQPFPPSSSTFLETGLHQIVYRATDCAGNLTTGLTVMEIKDIEPPMLSLPGQQVAFVDQQDCDASFNLIFPSISENCALSEAFSQSSGPTNIQFELNPNVGYVPKLLTLSVSTLCPNAVTGGVLVVRHKGDNNNAGEYFTIRDENNTVLSSTTQSAPGEECVLFHETHITVTANQINAWAQPGSQGGTSALFYLTANTDAFNFIDWIGPCATLNMAGYDGMSQVEILLEYVCAHVDYAIVNVAGDTIQSGVVTGQNTTSTLSAGQYEVRYSVPDEYGNRGYSQYALLVRDTIRPIAACKNRTVFTSVTGANPVLLVAGDIDNGSIDNCSGSQLNFTLSQSTFTCNQAGQIVPVTLTVTDTSGNSATCVASVNVATEIIETSSLSDICEGGTAQLFCDPPGDDGDYQYLWSGPGAYSSPMQNPQLMGVQLSQEGTYHVQVTGPTGCIAAGTEQLLLVGLPLQPSITVNSLTVCQGQNIVLNTTPYNGINVSYEWYEGSLANPLATTYQPTFTWSQPAPGNYEFYARVVDGSCGSAASAPAFVRVVARPAAVVDLTSLSPCEGDMVALGSPLSGPGITYQWTGPDMFSSTAQYPPVFNATQAKEGLYTLVVSAYGCAGTPATVAVDVLTRPAAPSIIGNGFVCEGSPIQLTANPPVGQTFFWVSPTADTITTPVNSLHISQADLSINGPWTVFTTLNGCVSPLSAPKVIDVEAYPFVVASGNSPLCHGESLNLMAGSDQSGLSYQWFGPQSYSAFGAMATDLTPETGAYWVTGTTPNGCADTDTLMVTFVAPPVITAVTSNAPTCADGLVNAQLFHTLVSPNAPFTYQWSGPGGFASTDAFPIIPTITTDDNGSYCLIALDSFGCASAPICTLIDVQMQPASPSLVQPQPVCQGEALTLEIDNAENYMGSGFTFIWNGAITGVTNQPQFVLPSASPQNTGFINVQVISGDCISTLSNDVLLTVNPRPITPGVLTNSPVCEGDTLYFDPENVAGVVDMWEWTGPAGFAPSIENPIRYPVQLNHAGLYNLRIKVNGCWSDPGEGFEVVVKDQPEKPSILAEMNVCLEQSDTLTLQIVGSQPVGAQYQWFNFATQLPLDTPSYSPVYQWTNYGAIAPGSNAFFARTILDGCASPPSTPFTVKFDTIPDVLPYAGSDYTACTALPLYIVAQPPQVGTGRWVQAGGPTATLGEPNNSFCQVLGVQPNTTYQFAWLLSNGGCRDYAADTLHIATVEQEFAHVNISRLDTCFATSVRLSAQQGQVAQGYWTQPLGQSMLQPPIVITNPEDPNSTVTGLPAGTSNTYYFVWNIESATCGLSTDTMIVRVVSSVPYAGVDRTLCSNDDCVLLSAAPLTSNETGHWYSTTPGISFTSPGNPQTTACGLYAGHTVFIWQTNDGICDALSRDTVVISYQQRPDAFADTYTVDFGVPLDFNVLANDLNVPPQLSVTAVSEPTHGSLTTSAPGRYEYRPDVQYEGDDQFIYRVCNLACTDTLNACDVALVTLNIGASSGCQIPTLITPNGDFVNDFWYIPCLGCADCLSDNEVVVFNQWGDMVFKASPYLQNWEGTYNGEPLPAGTYYFVVKYNTQTNIETKTGFIIIQR